MPFFLIFIGEALAFIKGVGGGVAALLFLLSCGVANWRANDRSEDFLAENYSAAVFAALPQGALLTTNNDFIFPLFYRRYALNERPDLTISNKFGTSENHNEDLNFVMDAKEFSNGYRDYGLFQNRCRKRQKLRWKRRYRRHCWNITALCRHFTARIRISGMTLPSARRY